MNKEYIEELASAIRKLHGCDATWLEAVPVTEEFEGKTVWQGVVHVFALHNHPTADRCYAWSHEVEGSTKQRFVAVLHQGPIDSPQNAVRAAIIQEYREKR